MDDALEMGEWLKKGECHSPLPTIIINSKVTSP
jgi:hypothetical protein